VTKNGSHLKNTKRAPMRRGELKGRGKKKKRNTTEESEGKDLRSRKNPGRTTLCTRGEKGKKLSGTEMKLPNRSKHSGRGGSLSKGEADYIRDQGPDRGEISRERGKKKTRRES